MKKLTKAEQAALSANIETVSARLHDAAISIAAGSGKAAHAVYAALELKRPDLILAELDRWIPAKDASAAEREVYKNVLAKFKWAAAGWQKAHPDQPKMTFAKPKGSKTHIWQGVQKPKGRNAKAKDGAEAETDSEKVGKAVKLTLHEAVKVLIESFGPEAVAREVALQIEKAAVTAKAAAKAA